MIFAGTETECAEVIAQLDAAHGYPRGYTQADVDSGLVVRVGGGIHVPLEMLRTETIAAPMPLEVDTETGEPIGDGMVVHFPELKEPEHRDIVVNARVVRTLNRGSKEDLLAVNGIGQVKADALLAKRDDGQPLTTSDLSEKVLNDLKVALSGDEDDYLPSFFQTLDEVLSTMATVNSRKH